MPSPLYIGLMSGTSIDAVDGALVEFASSGPRTLAFDSEPMPAALRAALFALQLPGPNELASAALAARDLAAVYAIVARRLTAAADSHGRRADLVAAGAHGQTVRHRPELGYTVQLIDGARLAELCGLAVVCDFRSADVAAGGQGAPLVPAFHAHAFGSDNQRRAIVNIGGIANVSLLAPGEPVVGFDTGPGNLLMDAWCEQHLARPYDCDGAWAATGHPHAGLLAALSAEPYFSRPAPKSTGRDLFDLAWLRAALARAGVAADAGAGAGAGAEAVTGADASTGTTVAPADVQACLLELTVRTIAHACRAFRADAVFVCGGGAANARLMQRLSQEMAPATVRSTAALGAPPQAVEAVAFAWLAARRIAGEPGNLVSATGARAARVLGALYPAPK